MGYPGKVKFPIISNHFAKCDHKGELSAVLSAIYYLKSPLATLQIWTPPFLRANISYVFFL